MPYFKLTQGVCERESSDACDGHIITTFKQGLYLSETSNCINAY